MRAAAAILLVIAFAVVPVRGDVIAAWSEALAKYASAPDVLFAPHVEARAYAMTHVAMTEAMAVVARDLRRAQGIEVAQRAAAVAAARESAAVLMPHARERIETLAAAQLAAIPNGAEKERGIACGRSAAAFVLRQREDDQWLALVKLSPPFGPLPDRSEQLAKAIAEGIEPPLSPWRQARPFYLKSATQIRVPLPFFTAVDGSVRTNFVLLGSKLFTSVDRTQPAGVLMETWDGNAIAAWNRIARAVALGRGLSLAEEARLFAVLNTALADATLSAMHWRFTIGSWNAMVMETWEDARGKPMLSTDTTSPAVIDGLYNGVVRLRSQRVLIPPIANYPSVAATLAGAAQAAMAECLKEDRTGFSLELTRTGDAPLRRTFGSIAEAARESAFVATLDGRHTREAGLAGHELGTAVGRHAARRFASTRR